ncbi:MAG: response regulator, partial [Cyanobacteria bacterium J06632_3]
FARAIPMEDTDEVLKFAESLIQEKTQTYCSELQRQILITALQEERKTYDQLAEECGYSPKYVKQDVAPKLWLLLSDVLGTKVTKANARAVLSRAMRNLFLAKVTPFSRKVTATTAEMTDTKATILLVDDQPQNLHLLSELLEEQGYDVQQAINGYVALEAIAKNIPDLVLLDIFMPQIDGYGVCQQIKSNPATEDVPVIFISALDEPWDKVKAFSAGGSDYITKPFKVVEVLARVENQLKIRQLQQKLKDNNVRLQQAIYELQRLAAIDELTEVASRRRFDAYLLRCWKVAARQKTALGLMFIQLDNASLDPEGIHENANAQAGDHTLQHLARLIQTAVQGPENLVCRYGTLTFAVILPQVAPTEDFVAARQAPGAQDDAQQTLRSQVDNPSENQADSPGERLNSQNSSAPASGNIAEIAREVGETLLSQTSKLHSETSQPTVLSISIVVMPLPTAKTTIETLLTEGDRNLQQANSQGGNCIVASALAEN